MVRPGAATARRVLRDGLVAIALFCSSAGFVLWQNAHVAVLFDLSYILNTAQRIASGQMPYRHFPLPHAPFTFLVQAAIIRLTGRIYFHHVLYAAIVGGLGTVFAWRIALNTLRGRIAMAWPVALLVAAPLVFLGVYAIVPSPEYDCDCGFWLVVALWFVQRLDRTRNVLFGFITGAVLCAPLFFKQNMGLPFLAVALGAVVILLGLRLVPRRKPVARQPSVLALLAVLAGAGATLAAAVYVVHITVGRHNYFHWTIEYAEQRRMPGMRLMLGVYHDPMLLWTLPCILIAVVLLLVAGGKHRWARIAAFAAIAAPFVYTLATLAIYEDADERGDSLLALWPLLLILGGLLALWNLLRLWKEPAMQTFLPLILLAAIHGTFLSQQLWGSTYGIWPLLALLAADLLVALDRFGVRARAGWFAPSLGAVFAATLLVCGGFYAVSEERLSYANLPAGPPAHSAYPQLAGLATPGPYLGEIDELLLYADANIPEEDGILLLPGEEPFYFATGRRQQFPVQYFDPTIDPYTGSEVASMVRPYGIRWLIVKRDQQTKEDTTPDREEMMRLLMKEFKPAAHLRGYDVYRRSF